MQVQRIQSLNPLRSNMYIVDERRDGGAVGLVDACCGSGYGRLRWLLGSRRPAWVFLTHWHCDHVGWLPQIVADYAPAVYCAPEAAQYLCNARTWRDAPYWREVAPWWVRPFWASSFVLWPVPHVESVTVVEPGDWLRFGGAEWAVIDLRGHTLGSVGLYDPVRGVLFSGDAVYREPDGALNETAYYLAEDRRAAYETHRRVAALGLWRIYPGHYSDGPVRAS